MKFEPKTYAFPQFIEGISHKVEGVSAKSFTTRAPPEEPSGNTEHSDNRFILDVQKVERENLKGIMKFNKALARYNLKQKLRLTIPSLPDSEGLDLDDRKDAARSRMRGRAGTFLTER